MYFDDHKHTATIIAGKRNFKGDRTMDPSPMAADVMKSEDGNIDGRHIAAQEILAAVHHKSPIKLVEALSNFMQIHHSSENALPDKE
jgi:hypothetical protein